MATKKNIINATINTNTEKNGYEIRFSEKPDKDFRKLVLRATYHFGFYESLEKAWIQSRENVSEDDIANIKAMMENLGYKVKETVDGKTKRAKKSPKKEEPKQEVKAEPKTEPVKEEKPAKKPAKKSPKKEEPKVEPKAEPVKVEDEELKIAKQIVEQNEKLINWLTSRR